MAAIGRINRIIVVAAIYLLLFACGIPDPERNADYDAIFVEDRLVNWTISVSDDSWRSLLDDQATYVRADVEVDGELYKDVGLRVVGNDNRSKYSMRIRFNSFDPGLRFHGVKRVNLLNNAGDPSLLREALALDLMRRAGIPAPRSSFVWVSLGNAGGVYTLVEQVDNRFLEDRFGEDSGKLYKLERGGNLVYRGEEAEKYDWLHISELKSDVETADHTALIRLMKELDESSGKELERTLPRLLEVDGFLLMLAVNTWLSNMESYLGVGGNLYLYYDSSGRFRVVPWNLNRAFGNYHGRHCKRADGEQYCAQASAEWCVERCQQLNPLCYNDELGGPGFCVETLAESCVEDPGRFCDITIDEESEIRTCVDKRPEYCEYTTEQLIELDPDHPSCSESRPLVDKVLGVASFKQRYHEHLRNLVDGILHPQSVEERINDMRALIAESAYQDISKDCITNDDFDAAFTEDLSTEPMKDQADLQLDPDEPPPDYRIPGLLPFTRARDEAIRKAIKGSRE